MKFTDSATFALIALVFVFTMTAVARAWGISVPQRVGRSHWEGDASSRERRPLAQ